ncbi:unnamed protein product, partial [Closterium sp. Naga37s-1]
ASTVGAGAGVAGVGVGGERHKSQGVVRGVEQQQRDRRVVRRERHGHFLIRLGSRCAYRERHAAFRHHGLHRPRHP